MIGVGLGKRELLRELQLNLVVRPQLDRVSP